VPACTPGSDSRAAHLGARLSTWLLRPYLDLGPLHTGPLHAEAVEEAWRAFADPGRPPFRAQRALPRGFREQLGREAGGAPYVLTDPRELPPALRTERWRALCAALDGWDDLPGEAQCRLASLLHSLCLYRPLLALIPSGASDLAWAVPPAVELAWWRASAAFMQTLQGPIADFHDADLSPFETIALTAPEAVPAAFNATALVLVHKAKTRAPLPELVLWTRRFEDARARAASAVDPFTAGLLTSRFYRAMGFLPQRTEDRREVERVMELAEHHARRLEPATPAERLLHGENLHAVMESRTKEALWRGDLDLALARSLEVVAVDPCDAKAWAEVGEVRFQRKEWGEAAHAYASAGMLGPPASAVGRHMAGVCLRELGQPVLAAAFFKDALELDPGGVSPREEIHELPGSALLETLKAWSRHTYPSP
jgi:tetratricopeptide (TPR) repeat protein